MQFADGTRLKRHMIKAHPKKRKVSTDHYHNFDRVSNPYDVI